MKSTSSGATSSMQRVSLKDIADELGISQTAVSFAINDRPGVSAETKRRVKEAAAKMGVASDICGAGIGLLENHDCGIRSISFCAGA